MVTTTIAQPAVQADDGHTKKVLDLVMGAGELMLRNGAETTRVEDTVSILARGFGFLQTHCLVTPTGIYVSLDDERLPTPVTLVHRVRIGNANYSTINAVNDLSRRVVRGTITLDEAAAELHRIEQKPPPYPFWLWLCSGAGVAAGIALLLGGSLFDMAPAFVSTIVVLWIGTVLGRLNIPAFFSDMLAGAIATAVALGLLELGLPVHAGLVIAGGIMKLVPGAALLTSVHDGISGNLLSAGARGLETLIKAGALASGVGLILVIGLRQGISISFESTGGEVWQIPIQVLAAFAASAAYGISNYVPRFAILTAGLSGAVAWLVYLLIYRDETLALPATFVAAFMVGLVSWGFARLQHAPITLYVLPGILPLLPGVTIFNGMLDLARNDGVQGLLTLAHALFLGGALAAGVALSDSLAPSIWRRRWTRRSSSRSDPADDNV